MKKLSFLLIGLFLVSFFFLSLSVYAQQESKEITIPEDNAVVVRTEGNVKVLKKGEDTWQPAEKDMKLSEGDKVKTGWFNAYCELAFEYDKKTHKTNIVRVSNGTIITLNKVKSTQTEIGLDKGELFCLVEKLKKGSTFQVRTPTAICGCRGTGFQIKYNPKTLILVYEHAVYVVLLDENGNPTGKEFIVQEGYKKIVELLEAGPTQELSDRERQRWNSWRKDLGELLGAYTTEGEGLTADAYTPPEGSSDTGGLGDDVGDLGDNASGSQNDANNDKQNEQNIQGNEARNRGTDSDGDGVLDSNDKYPNDPNRASGNDIDGDGIDDEFDSNDNDGPLGDADGDGVNNQDDKFPNDPNESSDNDNDGIGDNADTDDDNDGMPDKWENNNGLNPLVNDADEDPDGDNLTNKDEYDYNTNPQNPDTDDDGLYDGNEVLGITPYNYQTNPALADTDDDGALDGPGTDRFPLDTYEQADSDDDVGQYWNKLGYGAAEDNLFMPADENNPLYPGDNEDAFKDDNTIDGDGVYTDEFGNDYYGWYVDTDDDDGERDTVIRGYGSRYEIRNEILNMIEEEAIREDIRDHTEDIYLRDMDARLTQVTDAQMHKVMTDVHGNRVRIEQYVLRPTETSIQMLNINLRTGDTPLKGLTTLKWTMNFNRHLEINEIPNLPWEDYLTVRGSSSFWISSNDISYQTDANPIFPLQNEIELKHFTDNIYENITFSNSRLGSAPNYYQNVTNYQLDINGDTKFNNLADFKTNTISNPGNPANFTAATQYGDIVDGFWQPLGPFMRKKTQTRERQEALKGQFHVIDNSGMPTLETVSISSLMDMLRVGYFDLGNGSNLESIFKWVELDGDFQEREIWQVFDIDTSTWRTITTTPWQDVEGSEVTETLLFSSPIDLIIVPVSDINWQTDKVPGWETGWDE